MTDGELVVLSSLDELRSHSDAWDDLWSRSVTSSPTCRAELMACWVERFAPADDFRAILVQQHGRFVAALPLVTRKVGRVIAAGGLPINDWSQCGDLLLDEAIEIDDPLHTMSTGIQRLPWSILWLDGVRIETSRWQKFQQSLRSSGAKVLAEPKFEVGLLELNSSFADLQQQWSKSFRKHLRRSARQFADQGQYQLVVHTEIDETDVARLFERAMEVERKSWKSRAGSTMADSEGMAEFYLRQCRLLAKRQELVLAFLELEGQAVAFEIGWLAKSVYHSFKVSFDEQFSQFGPGQFILRSIIEDFMKRDICTAIDCIGPLSEATARFRPSSYKIGRMLIADRRLSGRAILSLYKNSVPHLRRLRDLRNP